MQSVIGSHVASLMADHLTDVQTSDQHTVKPWLSAHFDVSPPVGDLTDEGFPLVGGRLDYVDGHPAAAVVYRHDKHVINLFTWASPGKPDASPRTDHRQGFNVMSWRRARISYFVVSDVELNQARQVHAAGHAERVVTGFRFPSCSRLCRDCSPSRLSGTQWM